MEGGIGVRVCTCVTLLVSFDDFVPVAIHWIFDNVVSDTFGGVATAWLAFLGLFTLVIGLWVLVVWACGYL